MAAVNERLSGLPAMTFFPVGPVGGEFTRGLVDTFASARLLVVCMAPYKGAEDMAFSSFVTRYGEAMMRVRVEVNFRAVLLLIDGRVPRRVEDPGLAS